ncbi:MAG: S8 family serine peptidase [Actinobacteria bacterium]|nr:S8 family serine peptidase [Actinomycetota bacterium]
MQGKAVKAGRGVAVVVALVLLAAFFPCGASLGENGSQSPQLPVLLLNGAIYPDSYNPSSLPSEFRVDGYPSSAVAPYLLQFDGPLKEAWVEELRAIGAEPRGYLPYNTIMAGMNGEARSRLDEVSHIRWHGLYQPYFKLSPALQLRLSQGGEVTVLAMLFSPRFLAQAQDEFSAASFEVLGAAADDWCGLLALRMPVERLHEVAASEAVEWIELCGPGTLAAALREGRCFPRYDTYYQEGNVSGEVVGLCDTGLGKGGMGGIPQPLAASVAALDSLRGDGGADSCGHGTATAGVLAGAGGVALERDAGTKVQVIDYAVGYGLALPPQPLSLYGMLENAYSRGARTFLCGSVPEGRESLGAYGVFASQRDAFSWEHPEMTLVEAAGNEGTDVDGNGRVDEGSLLGGATAKNAISVGGREGAGTGLAPPEQGYPTYAALEGEFAGRFEANPLRDDSCVGGERGMAAFSSRGPTRDGRIKPDLVEVATGIAVPASGGEISAPGLQVTGDPGWLIAYGTSMAAARAAALMASMRPILARALGGEPTAALVKAFAVNGAADMSPGQYGAENPEVPPAPNAVEGWGSLDLSAFRQAGSWSKVVDDREGLRLGDARTYSVDVVEGDELRVTLAWSDYPSLPEARLHLVNDLDLRVVGPGGEVFYPNGRSSRDPLNNVERVVVDVKGKPGLYSVEISAWSVPFAPQPFALVAQVL